RMHTGRLHRSLTTNLWSTTSPHPKDLPPTSRFSLNSTAPPRSHTLSLHDALPIFAIADAPGLLALREARAVRRRRIERADPRARDRKSTRLTSHDQISYAVFCLKKKSKPRSPGKGSSEYAGTPAPPAAPRGRCSTR